MKKRWKTAVVFLLTGALLAAGGCGKKEEPAAEEPVVTVAPTEAPSPTPAEAEVLEPEPVSEPEPETEEKTPLPEGMMYSYLTGEPVDEAIGTQRPFAVMINNLQPAIPQSGLPQADIVYEIMVEGNITRLMAVFQDLGGLEKIGPIRSLRHYYMDFANDNMGWIVHWGASYIATDRLNAEGTKHLDGMTDSGFYRSSDRYAPHNAYNSAKGILDVAQAKGMSRAYPEGYEPNLLFHEKDTELTEGQPAERVNIPFDFDDPYFTYNAEDKLYYRYEYGNAHVDQQTGQQLAFKNIVVQYVDQWRVPGDDKDRQDMDLYTEGSGLYITGGKAIEITWKKTGREDATHYYDMAGNQIRMNPGKTMFEIVNNPNRVTFE